uniref:UPAR/Ly6 domain-containing protein n=1 Tax=Branchiostoma floridae TaxID=7739 RepID=C3YTU4_BRAFL|eukprot:XP_002600209.1 hypothetical protein BRAFLDRAFT_66714 [Branchiostoma floridae]
MNQESCDVQETLTTRQKVLQYLGKVKGRCRSHPSNRFREGAEVTRATGSERVPKSPEQQVPRGYRSHPSNKFREGAEVTRATGSERVPKSPEQQVPRGCRSHPSNRFREGAEVTRGWRKGRLEIAPTEALTGWSEGGALKCRSCTLVDTRAKCLEKSLTTCSSSQDVCLTTYAKVPFVGKKWSNICARKSTCDAAKAGNPKTCKTSADTFSCVYCCNTDGCVGAASAARVSIVTMATAALAVLLKNAAGF